MTASSAPSRRRIPGWVKLGVVLALLGGGAYYWYEDRAADSAQQRFRTAKLDRGTISNTVTANGTLRAVVTVDVGTQVSGQIKELLADYNTSVKAGQIIARIDPDSFQARVLEAEADVAVARANLEMQRVRVLGAAADIRQAKSAMDQAKLDLDRRRELLATKTVSQAQYDAAVAAFEQAEARYQSAVAKEAEQKAQIQVSEAQVKQKEAVLAQRKLDLENTIIRSPVDGVVIKRNVDIGQTVAASLQAPILFTIAQDLRQMQVEVNVDEADIGRIREGQDTSFVVDSFPGQSFSGRVFQVRKAPKEVSNVVTYTVIVMAENPDLRLLPGMTANVTFQIEERRNALRVPNAALRFTPPPAATGGASNASLGPGLPNPQRIGQGPGAGGNPQERVQALIRELELDKDQQEKARAIFEEMRKRFAQLRESGASEEQIREEMEKLRRQIPEKLNPILRPEQRAKYAAMRGRAPAGQTRRATVWVPGENGTLKRAAVTVGITDGSYTEVTGGDLKEGDEIVTGIETVRRAGSGTGTPATGGRPRFGF